MATEICAVCGNPVKSNTQMVQVTKAGELTFQTEELSNHLTWYPIGSDCARKVKSEMKKTGKDIIPYQLNDLLKKVIDSDKTKVRIEFDREFLSKVCEKLQNVYDEGPAEDGWKSLELELFIEIIEKSLNK